MALFEKALEANVMSTGLLIRSNVSKRVLMEAYAIATAFEARYSAYKEDSFLNQINREAGNNPVACTVEERALFERCLEASRLSGGAFDITIGAVSHGAYHFGFSNECVASEATLHRHSALVDYRFVHLDERGIMLAKKGMRLDLGGIGKGYVAGQIARFLQEKGATRALVDVGGEIVCFGKRYTIALKDPFAEGAMGYIKTSTAPVSISTSGDYERFIGSRECHHILESASGTSSQRYSAMTIIQNGFGIDMLDAFATAMFNSGYDVLKSMAATHRFALVAVDRDGSSLLYNHSSADLESISFVNEL